MLGGAGLDAVIGGIAGNVGMGVAVGAVAGTPADLVQVGQKVSVPSETLSNSTYNSPRLCGPEITRGSAIKVNVRHL